MLLCVGTVVPLYLLEADASVEIDGELLAGSIPVKQLKLIQAWLVLHEDERYAAWNKPVTVICARPMDGCQLQLRFSDGRSGIFNAAELLNQPAFVPLKDKAAFLQIFV